VTIAEGTKVLARGRNTEDDVRDLADRIVQEMEDSDAAVDEAAEPQGLQPFTVDFVPRVAAFGGRVLESPIEGVSDAAWTEFVLAMRVAALGTVSANSDLGMFAMKPRRLADLGLVKDLKRERSPLGPMVWTGVWKMSQEKFLASPSAQYSAFTRSMTRYVDALKAGELPLPEGGVPEDMSLSGMLAILHKCGPSGLRTWNDEANRFELTITLYEATNGVF
jgi:hypothetical protein